MSVVIETTLGDLTVDLYTEERPQTCLNFLKLCKMKYYNFNLFHSVNANFCAQTGDPTGKGDGGESIFGLIKGSEYRLYKAETQPKIKHNRTGLISMVSHGDGMCGSQFIITLSPDLGSLDGEHCVFGEVVEGAEVLLKLNEAITDEQYRPYQDIRVTHTVILEDPFPDPQGMLEIPASPGAPGTLDAAYSRLPADEPLTEEYSQEELNEMVQAREAAARATILEMVGDLPSADIAPPENVLFVCKLNPVTTDQDLSLIFSRFGKVKSCEVIRDAVTGDSLQYAFVEFEDKKSCEEAYFKMDNVLIDERRIHVDFSQSVAKWRGKGKGVEMLGPPPPGGWGNKSRSSHNAPSPKRQNLPKRQPLNKFTDRERNIPEKPRKQSVKSEKSGSIKREIKKKPKRRTPSSSSSSETSESSSSSSSSSSSESSYSEPVKKMSRMSGKVLLVVETPTRRRHATNKRVKGRSRKYSNDYTKRRRNKRNKKMSRRDSSSSDRSVRRHRRKNESDTDDLRKKRRNKKRKSVSSSSSSSSSDESSKITKKSSKKRSREDTSEKKNKRRKTGKKKSEEKKRRKGRSSSDSDSSSGSDSE